MKTTSKVDPETKQKIVNEAIETGLIPVVAKKYDVSNKDVHNWLRSFKGKDTRDANKQLREMQKKLKSAELENLVLKELLKKTYPHWQNAEKL